MCKERSTQQSQRREKKGCFFTRLKRRSWAVYKFIITLQQQHFTVITGMIMITDLILTRFWPLFSYCWKLAGLHTIRSAEVQRFRVQAGSLTVNRDNAAKGGFMWSWRHRRCVSRLSLPTKHHSADLSLSSAGSVTVCLAHTRRTAHKS